MPSSIVLGVLFADMTGIAAAAFFGSTGLAIASFAINYVVSSIVARAFAPGTGSGSGSGNEPVDNGVRQQVPPGTTNSIPVVYGDAYMGGTFVDAVLSNDQKTMYYVLAISSISPNGQFIYDRTNMYWADRKITFDATDPSKVVSLTDGAGNVDTKISGNLFINFFTSTQAGVITNPFASSVTPATVMGGSDVPPGQQWVAGNRQMNGLAFAIVKLNYNRDASTTAMQAITFRVSHYLNGTGAAKPGDVWLDYITSEIYGGAMSDAIIDAASATALNAYSDELITFTNSSGVASTQPRYRINGVIDTGQTALSNIDRVMIACDSWNQYNAASGKWAVVINKAQSATFNFDDSNIIGEIKVSALDITASINQVEAQFPSKLNRDQRDVVFIETPAGLLYPNEPVNKYSVNFDLVNDSVQTHYLANRMLEQAREDLIVTINAAYPAIQVDAGDVVTLTNAAYGWSNKLFRVMKVSEVSLPDGNLGASLDLNEYNGQVYDDQDITAFSPTPNSNFPDPAFFGTLIAPTVSASYPYAVAPYFMVQPYSGTSSFVVYAEVWYSAFSSPTPSQLFLGGLTQQPSNGVPLTAGAPITPIQLELPAGDWYFFYRLVNSSATSQYSPASAVFKWRPTTFQYSERYLAVAYSDNITGTTGFSYSPRGKAYYGLYNNTTANGGTNPALYTWYAAPANFGTTNFLLFANRANRKFSFDVGNAGYVNLGGAFVPTETSKYDSTVWAGLVDPAAGIQSFIDLDVRTGQTIVAGATGNNLNDGFLAVTNNVDGSMKVNLHDFLNFGPGVYTKAFNAATLTIDIYGRVVGFTEQDSFYYTETVFTATAGQTSFSITHTVGWALVFRNGLLCAPSEYTETGSAVVMTNACAAGEKIVVIYMRGVSTSVNYERTNMIIASSTSTTVTYSSAPYNTINVGDQLAFTNSGTPTLYTVSAINTSTKVITFSASIAGATVGNDVYRYRAAGSNYSPFSVYTQTVSAITTFTPTAYSLNNGFESIYINGVQISEIDYNLLGNTIDGFPAPVTGVLTVVMYNQNNLSVPASNISNTVAYSTSGQITYPFASNPLSMEVYANGALLIKGAGEDYTAAANNYNLTTAFGNNMTLLNQQTFARNGAA